MEFGDAKQSKGYQTACACRGAWTQNLSRESNELSLNKEPLACCVRGKTLIDPKQLHMRSHTEISEQMMSHSNFVLILHAGAIWWPAAEMSDVSLRIFQVWLLQVRV